jgi:hypothetical protein
MAAESWKEWQIPPFSHYISHEDQYEVTKARAELAYLTDRVLVPTAGLIDVFLDAVLGGGKPVSLVA